MRIKKMLAGMTMCAALVLLPTAAGAAPADEGEAYGEHVSMHAGGEGGFSGQGNPGGHRGFAGVDDLACEHH